MATLRIDQTSTSPTEVNIRESDEYTGSVYMNITHEFLPGEFRGCNEVFMNPSQLESLGKFLIRQADEIRTAQIVRKKS
jgi:hypothetical protein